MHPFAAVQFENVQHAWIWLVLTIAGAWVLYATYQRIFQRAQRRLAWGLMLLRGAGLAALVLALAKPSRTNRIEMVDPGRLAVVLDDSVSMSLADPSGKSRFALANEAAGRVRQAVEADASGAEVLVDLFDINGQPLADEIPEHPRAERTDLLRAVSQTTSHLRSKPLVGIVLISDGVDNTGRLDARSLGTTPVPIYAIGFRADPEASRLDLAVRRVQGPQRVIVNNEVKVDVLVVKTAGPTTQATILIKRGREEFASKQVAFDAGSTQQLVSLNFTPTQAGNFVFTASVSAETGERLLANNAKHFPLQVDADAMRVLYIEGFLRYEYKFLRNRLDNDPDVSLISVVRRANPQRMQGGSGEELITAERLKNFDVVILGNMEADYLTDAEYGALIAWIDEGHALVVLGGYHSFAADGFRSTPLADVLPVVFASKGPFQSEDPFVLELTEEGRRHPIFAVSGDLVKDAALWSTAPHLEGSSLVARAKQGADVLAVNPSFITDGKPAVVVATHRYGSGRTLVIAADTTWRWSRLTRVLGQADTLYARFWSQTIRWLSGRQTDEERPPIVLSTDRPDYEVGKQVVIRVVRQPGPDNDLASAEVGVEVTDETGKSIPVQLRAGPSEPDVFTGTFYPSSGGRYEVAAILTEAGKPIANRSTEFLVYGSDLELTDTGTNRAHLKSIATATGGLYFDIQDAAQLVDKIQRKDRRISRLQRTELWNSPVLFLFFLGAVTAEWVIRRRNHLV